MSDKEQTPASDDAAPVQIDDVSAAEPVGDGVPVPEALAAPSHDLTPQPEIIPVVIEEPASGPVAEHTPIVAPEPEPGPEPLAAQIAPEPTPTVSAADASFSRPAGSAAPPPPASAAAAPADRPEVLVGAAFAGGLVLAMIIKRLGR